MFFPPAIGRHPPSAVRRSSCAVFSYGSRSSRELATRRARLTPSGTSHLSINFLDPLDLRPFAFSLRLHPASSQQCSSTHASHVAWPGQKVNAAREAHAACPVVGTGAGGALFLDARVASRLVREIAPPWELPQFNKKAESKISRPNRPTFDTDCAAQARAVRPERGPRKRAVPSIREEDGTAGSAGKCP